MEGDTAQGWHGLHTGKVMGLGQKGKWGRGAFISVLLLLLIVWPVWRDAFMCYFYNYRNTRNEKLKKKITVKIN